MAGGLWLGCVFRAIQALRSGTGPIVDELEEAIARLEAREDVTRVGAVGFCLGGGFALLLGTLQKVTAAGVYYGDARPRAELARVCPLVGGYGDRDRRLAPQGRRLIADLDALGKEHDIRIYPDAGHSYLNHSVGPPLSWLARPLLQVEYNEQAAEDSWSRMLPFFQKHLGGDQVPDAESQ